jgi:NADH:ubiquinone oxidoreductase subunit E
MAADEELAELQSLLSDAPTDASNLLPLLQQVQRRLGYVSPGAIRLIAEACNLSRAEVYGVVTFYHDLRETSVGTHVVQVCMAEACQSVGCRDLMRHAETALSVSAGATTADGVFHLEAAYCFGNCALGPTIRIDDEIHGAVTPARLDALLTSHRRGI